ncbi:MAG: retroviral-like aspartic protease family protein [Dehalococcoidia bacterium]
MAATTISSEFILPAKPEDDAGEVKVPVFLENFSDRDRAEDGLIPEDRIRSTEIAMLLDTGATLMLLPQDVVEALGLKTLGRTRVIYADEREEERDIAGIVIVRVAGRVAHVACVVGPPGCEPLLGQVVLELTDLLVDCKNQRLVPNPDSPYMPQYKLK